MGRMADGEDFLHDSISQRVFRNDRSHEFETSSISAICLRQACAQVNFAQGVYPIRPLKERLFRNRVADDKVVFHTAEVEIGSDATSLAVHSAFQLNMDI